MNLTDFAELLVTKITSSPELVKVKEFDSEDEVILFFLKLELVKSQILVLNMIIK